MTDDFDRAADLEQRERDALIAQHKARTTAALPLCEHCEERPVHVASNGARWRYCADCAEDILRRGDK